MKFDNEVKHLKKSEQSARASLNFLRHAMFGGIICANNSYKINFKQRSINYHCICVV